jgi:hypothetical protein
MLDDEQAVEKAASKSRHCEEVHCGNCFAMIAQERRPTPCGLRISGSFPHPAQDGSLRDLEAEHLQFAMNPVCTPSRVFPDHSEDQLAELGASRFACNENMFAGPPFPIHPESGPMPTDDCVGLNEDQGFSPSGPQPMQGEPEKTIA